MVRAPCCEKMGLKKGPWTPKEDQILVAYIQRYGHGNWRALPKQAGLLRCGKSCRLRWTNYLRPDIKRGNFTREEEETIIKLHELLGNRWSAIAARLPGRTDNEIKNVWHTHLKKRLTKHNPGAVTATSRHRTVIAAGELCCDRVRAQQSFNNGEYGAGVSSPAPESSSDASSSVTAENCSSRVVLATTGVGLPATDLDENLWSEALSGSTQEVFSRSTQEVFSGSTPTSELPPQHQYEFPNYMNEPDELYMNDENLDFWYNLLLQSVELPELPDF